MSDVFSFEDFLGPNHCPRAASAGYVPAVPGGGEEGAAMLWRWTKDRANLGEHSSEPQALAKWLVGTQLELLLTTASAGAVPPPRLEEGFWMPSEGPDISYSGRTEVEVLGEPVQCEFHFPFYHEINAAREVVFCDLRTRPISADHWADFIHRATYVRECFHHATGENVYVRYLAPRRRVERVLDVPKSGLAQMVANARTRSLSRIIDPGAHCESSTEDGSYRCPLREEGACNPMKQQSIDPYQE